MAGLVALGWTSYASIAAAQAALQTLPAPNGPPAASGALDVVGFDFVWTPKPGGGLDQDGTGAFVDSTLFATKAYALSRQLAVSLASLTAATAPAAASATVSTETFSAAKSTRRKLDLTGYVQVRLTAGVIANGNAAGAAVKLSYMLTEAATWAGTDAGASIVLGTGTAGITRDSGWQTLAAGARVADVAVACLVGVAFGTTAPTIGSLTAYFR